MSSVKDANELDYEKMKEMIELLIVTELGDIFIYEQEFRRFYSGTRRNNLSFMLPRHFSSSMESKIYPFCSAGSFRKRCLLVSIAVAQLMDQSLDSVEIAETRISSFLWILYTLLHLIASQLHGLPFLRTTRGTTKQFIY